MTAGNKLAADWSGCVERLARNPYDPDAHAAVRSLASQPDERAELLEQAARQAGERASAAHLYTDAARVWLQQGDTQRASDLSRQALGLDPTNDRAARLLVKVLRTSGNDAAIASVLETRARNLERLCGQDIGHALAASEAYEALGIFHSESTMQLQAAVTALRRALELRRSRDTDPRSSTEPASDAGHDLRVAPESALRHRAGTEQPLGSSTRPAVPADLTRHGYASPVELRSVSGAPTTPPPSTPTVPDELGGSTTTPSPPPDPVDEPPFEDRLMGLFESLHAVRECNDVAEAAALVLEISQRALDARAGAVHLLDNARSEITTIATIDAHLDALVGTRIGQEDPLIARAFEEEAAIVVEGADLPGERWRAAGLVRSVLCAPLQAGGHNLGAIELVDPIGATGFGDKDRHAMTYVAERLTDWLVERGIV